jgi:hypothetical protein
MPAWGHSACDLNIQLGIATPEVVTLDQLLGRVSEIVQVRPVDQECPEAPIRAPEVILGPEQPAIVGTDDVIDAIGKQKPAIVGRYPDVFFRYETTIEIDDHAISLRESGCD